MHARDDDLLATRYLQTALAALRNLPDASVLVFDQDLRYVLVAGQAVAQSGFDADAMEGRSIAEVLPAERLAVWEPLYRAALSGQSSSVEVQGAGTSRWYRVDVGPWRDETGALAGGMAVGRDITDHKRAQDRVEGLLESAPDAMVVVDEQGAIVLVNAQTEKRFGYSRSELIGRRVEMLVPDWAGGRRSEHLSRYSVDQQAGGMGSELALDGLRKDGSRFPVEVSLSPLETEDGTLVSATIRDVTERNRLEGLSAHLAAVVGSSADAIISKTLDGTIVSWNPGAELLYGYSEAEVKGRSISTLFPDGDEDEASLLLAFVAAGGRVKRHETVRRRKDGSLVDVLLTISAVRDDTGQVVGASTIARDVTKAKAAEAALAQARNDIDQFFSVSPDVMAIIDADGSFVRVNRALERLLGLTVEEIVGHGFTEFMHPDDRQATADRYADRVAGAAVPEGFENRYLCADGSYRWLRWSTTPSEGGLVYTTARDVTERNRTENSLREATELLALSFDHSALGMTLTTPGRQLVRINRAFADMLGYTVEELLACEDQKKFTHPDDRATDEENLRILMAGNTNAAQWEKRYIHADGHTVCALASVSLLPHTDGTLRHIIAQVEDITERKRMAEELRASREEALEASRLKSEFVANMSHEIRTPLNGVVCMSELLLDAGLTAEQQEYAQVALTSAEALMRVINDILDFSKMEAGKLDIVNDDFSLETAVGDVCEIVGIKAREGGLELAVSIDAGVPDVIRGDGNRVRQVLMNLLSNAVKFTARGEVIVRVGLELATDATELLRIAVTDTGIGIDPAALGDLFHAFSQADATTTRSYGGTGLGLSIAKQLVELMGGEIGAESSAGGGSTFWFTVPCRRGTAVDGDPSVIDLAGTRVLIVDDSATNRQILERQLAQWGIDPDSADSGRAALELLHRAADTGAPYGAAVIDMQMPEMNGLELAKAIQAAPRLRSTRLIMLSSSPVSSADTQAVGIEAQLAKPVRQSKLYNQLLTTLMKRTRVLGPRPQPEQGAMPVSSGGHVLVAEDNEVNQFAAIHLLQKVGFSVDIARNGREAIDMSGRKDYTAVFMDCQMPEVDGYTATEAIRLREGGTKHTPIIAMTAHALDGDRDKCLAIGMDEYLAKPLRLQTIETLIGRLPAFRSAGHQSPDADTVFDSAQLSDIGDPDTEAALVSMFLDQASERLPQFKAAIDAGDDDRLHKLAHGLKGGAATVGAIRMAGLCGALCKLEASGNRPKAAEIHRQLADVLLDTAAAMHAYVERA